MPKPLKTNPNDDPSYRGNRNAMESSNPERLPRRDRGVPVITKIHAMNPSSEIDDDLNIELDRHGCWLMFHWKWNGGEEDQWDNERETEAYVEIEDVELFHILKDRIHDIQREAVPQSQATVDIVDVPNGVLPEDMEWSGGDPYGKAEKKGGEDPPKREGSNG
jgi:hypothetical protein